MPQWIGMGLPFSDRCGVGGRVVGGGSYRLGPEQVGEQCAVVHERLPKLFGRGLAPLVGLVDVVGLAVVVEQAGMLDGQVGDLLVEPAGRISPLGDQFGDQSVCLTDGPVGCVDEADLDLFPGGGVPLAG